MGKDLHNFIPILFIVNEGITEKKIHFLPSVLITFFQTLHYQFDLINLGDTSVQNIFPTKCNTNITVATFCFSR